MFIQDARVVRPAENYAFDRKKTVEMDPQDSHRVSSMIEEEGMSILGWYHSHPVFEVNPSNIDWNTHASFQKWFKQEEKAFIGIIVGPYSKNIDHTGKYTSLLNWFHLERQSNCSWSSPSSANLFKNWKHEHPYNFNWKLIPMEKVDQHLLEDLETFEEDDELENMSKTWKSGITMGEKFIKWCQNLAHENKARKDKFE